MTNRVSLAQALKMPMSEVSSLPIQHLALLLEDVAQMKQQATAASNMMFAALDHRFAEVARSASQAKGKETGTDPETLDLFVAADGAAVPVRLPNGRIGQMS